MKNRLRILTALTTVTALLTAVPAAVQPTLATATGPPDTSSTSIVRKDVQELTVEERKDFVDAVLALKATRSPFDERLSYYDQFVEWHVSLYRCSGVAADNIDRGHAGPFFLPWHRAFVLLFERALQEVSGERIAVPYWNWIDPASTAAVFQNDFMGGDGDPLDGYAVPSGPFRKGNWELNVHPEGAFWTASATTYLTRRFGSGGITPLPSAADLAWAMNAPAYDIPTYDTASDPNLSFRNALEGWWRADPGARVRFADPVDHWHCGPDQRAVVSRDGGKMHNQVHSWTGGILATATGGTSAVFGTMLLPTSPNDPTFFLHHANIDRLWTGWQAARGGAGIEPADRAGDKMQPFLSSGLEFSPASVNRVDVLGYTYSAVAGDVPSSRLEAARPTPGAAPTSSRVDYLCPVRR